MTNSTVEVVKKCCCGNFKELASQAVADIKARAGKDGMFLNWIEKLPNIQLANLDKMEEMVKIARKSGTQSIGGKMRWQQ